MTELLFASSGKICNNRVDLPIPGSPLKSIEEPETIPPPRTLLKLLKLVFILSFFTDNPSALLGGCL